VDILEGVAHQMEVVVYFVRPIVFALVVSLVVHLDGRDVYILVDAVLVGLAPVVDLVLVQEVALALEDLVEDLDQVVADNNLAAPEEEEHHTHSNCSLAAAAQTYSFPHSPNSISSSATTPHYPWQHYY